MLRQETLQTSPGAPRPAERGRPRGAVLVLAGLVVVLAVALAAIGTTYAVGMLTTTPGEALADDMIVAWNAHDADAARAFYTSDAFVMTSAGTTPDASGIDEIAALARYGGLTIERTGPVTERAGLVWWPIRVTSTYDVAGAGAVAVMVLNDGKIAEHWVIWDGTP